MQDIADRLLFLRKRAKIRSKRAAAKAYGIGYEVYKKIEAFGVSDRRNLTVEQAVTIGKFHKISPAWLLFNDGPIEGEGLVKLEGKIGAGQEMMTYDTLEEFISSSLADESAVAFAVEGDSMLPIARQGDIVFIGPPRRDIKSLIGRECAVLLQDGRRFLKIIERGTTDRLFKLISYNAEPISDVEIHSAGPLIAIRRARA